MQNPPINCDNWLYVRDREDWTDKENDLAILYLPPQTARKCTFTRHLQINEAPIPDDSSLSFYGYIPDKEKNGKIKAYAMKGIVVASGTSKNLIFVNPEDNLSEGMSGSAVLNANGQLIGILGGEVFLHAVVIPSAKIKALLEKAKAELKKEIE